MRLKLAGSCLFGVFFLFVSSGSANIQRSADVPLRPSLIEKARDKLASLPGAAESFFHQLGAPETRDPDARDTIDAPKDTRTPTSLERARLALAESSAPALSHNEALLEPRRRRAGERAAARLLHQPDLAGEPLRS